MYDMQWLETIATMVDFMIGKQPKCIVYSKLQDKQSNF